MYKEYLNSGICRTETDMEGQMPNQEHFWVVVTSGNAAIAWLFHRIEDAFSKAHKLEQIFSTAPAAVLMAEVNTYHFDW